MREITTKTFVGIIFFILHKKNFYFSNHTSSTAKKTEDSLCLQLPVAPDQTCRGTTTNRDATQ